jgi:hypothetical protein
MGPGIEHLGVERGGENADWRILAERATRELDSRKLLDLVAQLCTALDHQTVRGSMHYMNDTES